MIAILLLLLALPFGLLLVAGIYLAFRIACNCGTTEEAVNLWIRECSK